MPHRERVDSGCRRLRPAGHGVAARRRVPGRHRVHHRFRRRCPRRRGGRAGHGELSSGIRGLRLGRRRAVQPRRTRPDRRARLGARQYRRLRRRPGRGDLDRTVGGRPVGRGPAGRRSRPGSVPARNRAEPGQDLRSRRRGSCRLGDDHLPARHPPDGRGVGGTATRGDPRGPDDPGGRHGGRARTMDPSERALLDDHRRRIVHCPTVARIPNVRVRPRTRVRVHHGRGADVHRGRGPVQDRPRRHRPCLRSRRQRGPNLPARESEHHRQRTARPDPLRRPVPNAVAMVRRGRRQCRKRLVPLRIRMAEPGARRRPAGMPRPRRPLHLRHTPRPPRHGSHRPKHSARLRRPVGGHAQGVRRVRHDRRPRLAPIRHHRTNPPNMGDPTRVGCRLTGHVPPDLGDPTRAGRRPADNAPPKPADPTQNGRRPTGNAPPKQPTPPGSDADSLATSRQTWRLERQ